MSIFKRRKIVLTDTCGDDHSITFDDILELKVRKDSNLDFLAMMSGSNSIPCIFADFTTADGTFSVDCDFSNYQNLHDQLALIFPEKTLVETKYLKAVTSLILEPFDKSITVYTK